MYFLFVFLFFIETHLVNNKKSKIVVQVYVAQNLVKEEKDESLKVVPNAANILKDSSVSGSKGDDTQMVETVQKEKASNAGVAYKATSEMFLRLGCSWLPNCQ